MSIDRAVDDPRLKEVVLTVEATSFERSCLWERFAEEARRFHPTSPMPRVLWEQDSSGWLSDVGHIEDSPVCISVMFARIAGHMVLFWEATSIMVNHTMIADWLLNNVPAHARGHHCDAGGFSPGRLAEDAR